MKKKVTRLFSVLLAAVLVFGTLPVSALGTDVADPPASAVDESVVDESSAAPEEAEPAEDEPAVDDAAQPEEQSAEEEAAAVQSGAAVDGYDMNIFFLDCGRKYYSVDSIKTFINEAHDAGFNYIQLAVGNDGLRFLLDNMELTVNGTTYASDAVSSAIHKGNEAYYNFDVDELTQSDMDTIIDYAHSKGMGVIPCVNTPGHMDAILDAAEELTDKTCSYNKSARTIDVTNTTAVAFTQALLQKYITYFAGKGCEYFNMGADEYANDRYTSGSMGFGNLQSTGKYSYYVTYVNQVAALIKGAGMKPMAFNDGIYFQSNTSYGTFDTDIVICYWSDGWTSYTPMPAADLAAKGFKLVNTHGSYYWVLGKTDWQCDATKASGFNCKNFQGGTIDNPVGSMFCVWADYPGAETDASVISKTAATIKAFGGACPTVKSVNETPTTPTEPDNDFVIEPTEDNDGKLVTGEALVLNAGKKVVWTAEPADVVTLESADAENGVSTYSSAASVEAQYVKVTAAGTGDVVITAADTETGKTADYSLSVTSAEDADYTVVEVTMTVGETKEMTDTVSGDHTGDDYSNEYVTVATAPDTVDGSTYYEAASFEVGKELYISEASTAADVKNAVKVTFEAADDDQYYVKLANDSYIYPNASYGWRTGWSYSLGETQESVTVAPDGNSIAVSKAYTHNGIFGTYNTNAYLTLSGTTFGADDEDSDHTLYLYTQKTTQGTTNTKVTFTAKQVTGDTPTEIIIGNVKYKITITAENLDGVTREVQFWITNNKVTANGDNSMQIAAKAAYGSNGVEFSTLVPPEGKRGDDKVVFWKGTRLTTGNYQTTDGGVDKTLAGHDFAKIRYYGGTWSIFCTTDNEWEAVSTDDQLVAYYMQVTKVTDEVTTNVVDWGPVKSTATNQVENNQQFVLLDFAVHYDSTGETKPDTTKDNTFPVSGKTIVFHCTHKDGVPDAAVGTEKSGNSTLYYRNIGMIRATDTAQYEVYMITVTPNNDDKTTNGQAIRAASSSENYKYKGTEKAVWVASTKDLPEKFSDESKQDNLRIGGDAIVPSLKIYEKHAMLVTYYVREKELPDSLHVYYVDEQSKNTFHTSTINVKKGVLFDPAIALDTPWKGPLKNGTVENFYGYPLTVTADLTNLNIAASYRRAEYTCVRMEKADGDETNGYKNIYLYYNFSTSASFVIDFGSKLTLTPTDISSNLSDANLSGAKLTEVKVNEDTQRCGKATVNKENDEYTITFEPDTTFAASESGGFFQVSFTGTRETDGETKTETVSYNVYIYPASNVLYEENFLEVGENERLTSEDYTWKEVQGKHSAPQQTQKTTDTGKFQFGYDSTYDTITDENGAWKIEGLTVQDLTRPLTTTFYGNGFDLIGNCAKDSGRVMVLVTDKDGKTKKLVIVDTRYDDGNGNTLNQVPLAHLELGEEATYTAKVYTSGLNEVSANSGSDENAAVAFAALYNDDSEAVTDDLIAKILESNGLTADEVEIVYTSVDESGAVAPALASSYALESETGSSNTKVVAHDKGTHVEINGFRVYRSSATSETGETATVADNYPESERDQKYMNILDVVKGKITAYTETANEAVNVTVENYETDGGPQNEIYLTNGYAVQFQIKDLKEQIIYVSLRAVKSATNYNDTDLSSITEMYYPIKADENGVFTIRCDSSNMLAIGNVKLPSSIEADQIVTPDKLSNDTLAAALNAVLHGDEEKEVFTPETFKVTPSTTNLIKNKVVTLKINVSSDVAYVTVDGVKYTRSGLQGMFQKTRTIRVVKTAPRNAEKTYEIIAYNSDGVASEPTTVTVK